MVAQKTQRARRSARSSGIAVNPRTNVWPGTDGGPGADIMDAGFSMSGCQDDGVAGVRWGIGLGMDETGGVCDENDEDGGYALRGKGDFGADCEDGEDGEDIEDIGDGDDEDDEDEGDEGYEGDGDSPGTSNTVGMFLHQASDTRLLSREEEVSWFRVIEASLDRVGELFSRYLFAPDMYVRELDRLLSGETHFDSVVSESSGMRCSAYKQAIPGFKRCIAEASDMVAGASMLRYSARSPGESVKADGLLQAYRDEMRRRLKALHFRQSVVESFCDSAKESVYSAYMDLRRRADAGDADAEARAMDMEPMFGMPPGEFMDSFGEVISILGVVQSARTRITEANLRLVVHVAKKYANRGIDMSDLLQDGSMGLMTAVRKFDLSRGHKFSTFATWWIRQAISRSLTNNSRTVRLPSHMVDLLNKMGAAEKSLTNALGREPGVGEIADEMGVTPDRIESLRRMRQHSVSLDSSVDESGDTTLGDLMGDETAEDPAEEAGRHMVMDGIREAMSCLTERERIVIDLRFGLSDGSARTLEEIGRVFNVTREHIRKIELEAMEKLRGSRAIARLSELSSGGGLPRRAYGDGEDEYEGVCKDGEDCEDGEDG